VVTEFISRLGLTKGVVFIHFMELMAMLNLLVNAGPSGLDEFNQRLLVLRNVSFVDKSIFIKEFCYILRNPETSGFTNPEKFTYYLKTIYFFGVPNNPLPNWESMTFPELKSFASQLADGNERNFNATKISAVSLLGLPFTKGHTAHINFLKRYYTGCRYAVSVTHPLLCRSFFKNKRSSLMLVPQRRYFDWFSVSEEVLRQRVESPVKGLLWHRYHSPVVSILPEVAADRSSKFKAITLFLGFFHCQGVVPDAHLLSTTVNFHGNSGLFPNHLPTASGFGDPLKLYDFVTDGAQQPSVRAVQAAAQIFKQKLAHFLSIILKL